MCCPLITELSALAAIYKYKSAAKASVQHTSCQVPCLYGFKCAESYYTGPSVSRETDWFLCQLQRLVLPLQVVLEQSTVLVYDVLAHGGVGCQYSQQIAVRCCYTRQVDFGKLSEKENNLFLQVFLCIFLGLKLLKFKVKEIFEEKKEDIYYIYSQEYVSVV